ncbi:MAG TPA: phosphatidylserine/phosphatidylglycerophosphate/cardiolipin synthase family protein [Chloroflexia bacterium]|nr:phosphatidylserine/phosphatidylglycerophosphate/cardiolipin synthase family protein [Chloroflexia bacterium]
MERTEEDIAVYFLAQGEQTAEEVVRRLVKFIGEAQKSLDMAFYDFRLSENLRQQIAAALQERANAGVSIRIAYDADKPETPELERGMDPAPAGTGQFVQSLGYPWRRIGGLKLMHHKYIVRDAGTEAAAVWTGSTNMTDDSWTLQENNILTIESSQVAGYYTEDFNELWKTETIGESGSFDTRKVQLTYDGQPADLRLLFSPGRGPAIDYEVAHRVAQARRKVRICSMLLNSSALIAALTDLLCKGDVDISGIYDRTQMDSVLEQWQDVPHNHWKIGVVEDIIKATGLAGKDSTPYSPNTPHDFMHNKVLVIDDTVITGSYNFSRSAEFNAENILMIENEALADQYNRYIDHLVAKYR